MRFCGITQIGETQFGFSFRQCDTVKAVRIGGGSLILMTLNDVTANQRLGRRPVSDISADSKLAAYRLLLFLLLRTAHLRLRADIRKYVCRFPLL